MTDSSKSRMKRLLPFFNGSIGFAVFNVHESDKTRARKRFIKEFGLESWKKDVKPKMRTGIMEIFDHPPTRPLRRYAWYCALSVERRIANSA